MTIVTKSTLPVFRTGRKAGIGTTAVQLTTLDVPLSMGVFVKAHHNNGVAIYVGPTQDVDALGSDLNSGYELLPTEWVFLEVDNANKVWLIALSGVQQATWKGA